MDTEAEIRAVAERVARAGPSRPRQARDPVNLPMIRNWIEAVGDADPVYTDAGAAAASVHGSLVAPPAMIQAWTMPGLHGVRDDTDPLGQMSAVLDAAGYTSVVATNCDQTYHRYLRHGEQLAVMTELVDVTGPKRTALGEGWFVTTRSTWHCDDEAVATMDFRILKFRPPSAARPAEPAGAGQTLPAGAVRAGPAGAAPAGQAPAAAAAAGTVSAAAAAAATAPAGFVLRPMISSDTAFFWAGAAAGELRIQRCGGCGALRHPPGPMCPHCGGGTPEYIVAAGTGLIYSYVVHHHPPVPGKRLPIVIVLVQLDEGVRILGELLGAEPARVRIGLPVRVEYVRIDDELTMPAWRLADGQLPELAIEVSPTFVVSTALATRDFQDVHHDRDRAVARGSKDIFLNILTTTGLVQRYVTGWAGPGSVVREISIRLGAPCYAGDTLTFSGHVTSHAAEQRAADAADAAGSARASAAGSARDAAAGDQAGGCYEVSVTGRCSLGDHVTGTVRIDIPRSRS